MRTSLPRFRSTLTPRVRYVDQEQAVIEVNIKTATPLSTPDESSAVDLPRVVDLHVEVSNADGFADEQTMTLSLDEGAGTARFDIVHPQRWWPAGMGDQTLYDLTVTMLHDGREVQKHHGMMGMTSVRPDATDENGALLVNGQACEIQNIVAIDQIDERRMLPVGSNSLLIVRGHYGTDLLYDAADRAGILLIQCVPLHPRGHSDEDMAPQIERLAAHPSLAGWFVGHLGTVSKRVAAGIQLLDPTRSIFHVVPGFPSARAVPGVNDLC